MLKTAGLIFLAVALTVGAVVTGCSYSRVLRNRLRERAVDGLAGLQAHVELVAADLRTVIDAQTAGDALLLAHIARVLPDGDREVAGITLAPGDFCVGDDLDERMPTGIHGLRPENSYGAVHGGEGLVELGHAPAERR